MSYMKNQNSFYQGDEWDELNHEIKLEVNENEYSLPPGLNSTVANKEESSSGSHYTHSQDNSVAVLENQVWKENYNSKGSFGQNNIPLTGFQFLGPGIRSQNLGPQSFSNPQQVLKQTVTVASPPFEFPKTHEKVQEGNGSHFKQIIPPGPETPQVQIQEEHEDLLKGSQNEIGKEEERLQEEPQQNEPELQKEQEGPQQQEPENKLEQSQLEIPKEKESSQPQEPENKTAWGKPLKKEVKDNKKSQQLQKSDEKEVKKPAENKTLSGNIVGVTDFKFQPEKVIENLHKSENIDGKKTKEGNLKMSRTFEKEVDQNKNHINDKQTKTDKKSTNKDDKATDKTRSHEGWENTKTKTTSHKSEAKNNNQKLKLANTPFALLRMSESGESNVDENDDVENVENLEETPKGTNKKLDSNEQKKKKKKNKKKKGESMVDVDEDKKDEAEMQKGKENKKESQSEIQGQDNEKGIKDDEDADLSGDEDEKLDEPKTVGKKKKKKKKKQNNEGSEDVDPQKVSKQIEEVKQKEGTSKSFARGGGKDSKGQEPLSERFLFVPPLDYYNDLFKSMEVSPAKELIKE